MCRLAAQEMDGIMVDDWEARQSACLRTLLVLQHFEEALGASIDVMLLSGADLVKSFHTPGVWIVDQVRELLRRYGVICIDRGDVDVEGLFSDTTSPFAAEKDQIHIVRKLEQCNVSSSLVRSRVQEGRDITAFVPIRVRDYILSKGLYAKRDA